MASEMVSDLLAEDKLVELWADFPCLFDVTSPDFKNRDKRQQAIEFLAETVEQNVEWVKTKLRLLRNSYTKAKKAPSSGSARKPLSKRSQWLVDKLQFLAPFCASRPTVSNLDFSPPTTPVDEAEVSESEELSQNESTEFPTRKSTKEPTKVKSKSLKRKREEEEYELIKGIATSLTQKNTTTHNEPDEVDVFGRYICAGLRGLEAATRLIVQNKIQNILFEAQLGAFRYVSSQQAQVNGQIGAFQQPHIMSPTPQPHIMTSAPQPMFTHMNQQHSYTSALQSSSQITQQNNMMQSGDEDILSL